jgi:hypothetical protein
MTSAKKPFLTETVRGTLASGLVVISVSVLSLGGLSISAKAYLLLAVVSVVYGVFLTAYAMLLTGKSQSEVLKRVMILVSLVAFGSLGFLVWAWSAFLSVFQW